MIPDDPQERDALAGEYVLGALDHASYAAMTLALDFDADLGGRVERWQRWLDPLDAVMRTPTLSTDLWPRIDASVVLKPQSKPWQSAGFWQLSSAALGALAAGLGALLLTH